MLQKTPDGWCDTEKIIECPQGHAVGKLVVRNGVRAVLLPDGTIVVAGVLRCWICGESRPWRKDNSQSIDNR